MPEEIPKRGFHLVTTLEFLEHLQDPAAFIAEVKKWVRSYIMVGSPLGEAVTPYPKKEHLWSFSQTGYETLIRKKGLNIALSNAMHIVRLENNHDWITRVESKGIKLSDAVNPPVDSLGAPSAYS